MSVCCKCCVLSGRGLCDELITRPEESYRLWCVVVCDLETTRMRRPWPALGRSATGKNALYCNVFDTFWCETFSWWGTLFYSFTLVFHFPFALLAYKTSPTPCHRVVTGSDKRYWSVKIMSLWKGEAVPLQARTGPEGSRKLRFPDFVTTAQDGGKVVNLTHRPPLPPGNAPGTHFC